jgi:hypothetical protein
MIKKILGYSILIIHSIILPTTFILLLFFKNFIIDYLILLYFTIVILGWIIFGNCILTPLENYLLGKKEYYDDNIERSRITIFLEDNLKINKNKILYFFVFSPMIIITIILFKIYFFYNKNNKQKYKIINKNIK